MQIAHAVGKLLAVSGPPEVLHARKARNVGVQAVEELENMPVPGQTVTCKPNPA